MTSFNLNLFISSLIQSINYVAAISTVCVTGRYAKLNQHNILKCYSIIK